MSGNTWPEQDIFYDWAEKNNVSVTHKQALGLIEEYTDTRVENDRRIRSLEKELTTLKASIAEVVEKMEDIADRCRYHSEAVVMEEAISMLKELGE